MLRNLCNRSPNPALWSLLPKAPGCLSTRAPPRAAKRSTQHLAHPSPSGTSPGPSATSQRWGKWPRGSRAGSGHVRRPPCPGQPCTSPEVVEGGKPLHGEGFCSRARGSGLWWWPSCPPQPPERQQPGSGAGKQDTHPWPQPCHCPVLTREPRRDEDELPQQEPSQQQRGAERSHRRCRKSGLQLQKENEKLHRKWTRARAVNASAACPSAGRTGQAVGG